MLLIGISLFTPAANADEDKTVKFGAYINQVRDVDLKSQSFSADVYVWFKWKDQAISPDETFEFMNTFDASSSTLKKSFVKIQKLPNGENYQVIRYQGRFSSDISLRSYPFDRQTLKIIIEDNALTTTNLTYVASQSDVSVNKDLALPGYEISIPRITIVNQKYPTDFGYPTSGAQDIYSRVVVSFDITRPFLPYLLKLIFPIFLVVMIAGLAFWITTEEVEARVGMVVTALLTLVALQITTNSNLPEVEYLMLIDLLYNISFAFVLVVMIDVVVTTHFHKNRKDEIAVLVGKRVRVASIVIYLLLIAISLYIFYN